jgi:adenine-specific DNA-methyltransferase
MDELFRPENFVSQIAFVTTTGRGGLLLDGVYDILLWYAKDREQIKYRQIFKPVPDEQIAKYYDYVELDSGEVVRLNTAQKEGHEPIPLGKRFALRDTSSQGESETGSFVYEFEGKGFTPPVGRHWSTTREGMDRLAHAGRLYDFGRQLRAKRYVSDFPVTPINNMWDDTQRGSFVGKKIYVVQTSEKVIERCILMTTDPGDLVFDPTCGSGTAAYAAEKWGRRWITCDTSRVAVSLARQRLLTSTYPYYQLYDENVGVKAGFVYATAPHIMFGGIANNPRLDPVIERHQPRLEDALAELNRALGASLEPWEVPFEPAPDWPVEAVRLHREYLEIRQARQREIDAIIAADAPQETLYDQPEMVSGVTRVSGPFTVEAIPPAAEELVAETPIGGAPEPEVHDDGLVLPPAGESGSHIPLLINLMRKDGVTFPGNRSMQFESLTARNSGVLHAEGVPAGDSKNGLQRIAVSFGPQYGPVTQRQVEQGLREAYMGGFDAVIFAGFEFDGPAQAAIEKGIHPHVQTFLAHIRPDVLLTDAKGDSLLKTTARSQLFSVFGEPDIELRQENGEYVVELRGVDIYDPIDGQVYSAHAGQIAAWFVDTDYDGRTFCIVQAFFPNKSAWKNIERALRGTLNQERYEQLTGRVSLPFEAGEHRRVAVKVIDQRGNEVMRVLALGEAVVYAP